MASRGRGRRIVRRRVVEGDAEADLDLPAGNSYVFDDDAEELLALVEVEAIEGRLGTLGEVLDALAEPVVRGQFLALRLEVGATLVQLASPRLDLFGARLKFDELDQAGLVEVDQAAPFAVGGRELALEAGELSGQQLVVGSGMGRGQRRFAGEEDVGSQQSATDLVEDERVEGVRSDPTLAALAVLAAGLDEAVVAAVVVAEPAVLVAPTPLAGAAAPDSTGTERTSPRNCHAPGSARR